VRGVQAEPADAALHAVAAAAFLRQLRVTGQTELAYAVRDHSLAARRDTRFHRLALRLLAETCLLQDRPVEARETLESLVALGVTEPETLALLAGAARHCHDRQPPGA